MEILAPMPRPPKIIGSAQLRRHAAEGGLAVPNGPRCSPSSRTRSLTRPEIEIPDPEADVDYEVEVGRRHRATSSQTPWRDRPERRGGYTVANDVSAGGGSSRISQWTSGKTSDGFCPIGPWLATPSSVPDPRRPSLADVNGRRDQDSSTADMAFEVDELVVYLSSLMTLSPGDLILTGTPEGVGLGKKPPRYLGAGDTVTLGSMGSECSRTDSSEVPRTGRTKGRLRTRLGSQGTMDHAIDAELASPSFLIDPYPVYRRLREEAPLYWSEELGLLDVIAVSRCPRVLRDGGELRVVGGSRRTLRRTQPDDQATWARFGITSLSGYFTRIRPEHTRLRRLVSQAFTPKTSRICGRGCRPRRSASR